MLRLNGRRSLWQRLERWSKDYAGYRIGIARSKGYYPYLF